MEKMMPQANLLELADRVEKEKPCDILDAEVFQAVGFEVKRVHDPITGHHYVYMKQEGFLIAENPVWKVTRSVDAALKLIEELLTDGYVLNLSHRHTELVHQWGIAEPLYWVAQLQHVRGGKLKRGKAPTLAAAILATLLRAQHWRKNDD